MAGVLNTTLILPNIPAHTHTIGGTINSTANNDNAGLGPDPTGRRLGSSNSFTNGTGDQVNMANNAFALTASVTGGNQAFSTTPPYEGIQFVFCVEGIFPSRD
jgi:microcystin-dependent protein